MGEKHLRKEDQDLTFSFARTHIDPIEMKRTTWIANAIPSAEGNVGAETEEHVRISIIKRSYALRKRGRTCKKNDRLNSSVTSSPEESSRISSCLREQILSLTRPIVEARQL